MENIHPLKSYLNGLDMSVAAFAKIVGADRTTIYRICAREAHPKPDLGTRIVDATSGIVTFEDLFRVPNANA